jgi:UMF1 family MFS transporter
MPKPPTPISKRATFSWCLYDWANTAFGTVIITFIYSVYFAKGIVGDETYGASLWAYAIGFSGLLIAFLSPVFGSVADHTGSRKPWILFFTLLCSACTALLYVGVPGSNSYLVVIVLGLVVLANIGLEMGTVFYNAMLPDIANKQKIGRISGLAWAMGYIGGLCCLVVALFGLVGLGDTPPLIDLPQEDSENIRATAPLTALWLIVFSIPMFLFTPDQPRSGLSFKQALKKGLSSLKDTLTEVRQHKNLLTFLISSAIYRDGLNTLFAVGGLYAAGRFGMEFEEILIFAIGLNVSSGLGAAAFAYLDDIKGSKPTILIALAGLIGLGMAILMIEEKETFMMLAIALGIFIGPAQAASRTLCGRLAPPDSTVQTYGLYAFTGKSIAFLGPLAYGFATNLFDTQQAGMVSILLFWAVGFALLCLVKEKNKFS